VTLVTDIYDDIPGRHYVPKILISLAFLYPNVYHLKPRGNPNENADPWVGVRDDSVWKNLGFVQGLQALSTHIDLARLAIHHHRALGDVGAELAVGAPLGKAYIVPELRTLATYFTLSHWNHLFAK
jgi:hypothetical protein